MAVIYAAVQNVVDTRGRLRRFMLVAALASLGPALGAIEVAHRRRPRRRLPHPLARRLRRPEPARDGHHRGPPLRAVRRGDGAAPAGARALLRRGGRPSSPRSSSPTRAPARSPPGWRCCSSWRAGGAARPRRGRGGRDRGGARGVAPPRSGSAPAPSRSWRRTSRSGAQERLEGARRHRRGTAVHRRRGRRVHPRLGPLRSARGRRAPLHRAQRPPRDRRRARHPRVPPVLRVRGHAPRPGLAHRGGPARRDRRAGGVRRARRLPRLRDGGRLLAVVVPVLPVRCRCGLSQDVRRARAAIAREGS